MQRRCVTLVSRHAHHHAKKQQQKQKQQETAETDRDQDQPRQEENFSFSFLQKDSAAEVHHFKQLSGELNSSGKFNLIIDLSSVDTGIAIRDQRMIDYLFETSDFATARMTATLAEGDFLMPAVGQSVDRIISGELELHGLAKKLALNVMITRVSNDILLVNSVKPVVIQAADFGLVKGVEKLRDIAKLPRISHAVPVSFVLRLQKK